MLEKKNKKQSAMKLALKMDPNIFITRGENGKE